MKINSLNDVNDLQLATSNQQVDERVSAIFNLIDRDNSLNPVDIVEAFFEVACTVCYSEHMTMDNEHRILSWITKTYLEDDERYMDSVAGLYALMSCKEAKIQCLEKLLSAKNGVARAYLSEALNP